LSKYSNCATVAADERFGRRVAALAGALAHKPRFSYSLVMLLPVELTESQVESLRQRAKTLGVSPEQLAAAAVADLVAQPADDFQKAAARVLSKNSELYRRLA
jgi:hypothetical protein